MKKLIFLPALLFLTLAGCNKIIDIPVDNTENQEQTENVTESAPITFFTQAQEPGTKVTLDGLQLKWKDGDQIAVYSFKADESSPVAVDRCTLTSAAGSASGTFAPNNYGHGSDWITTGTDSDSYNFYSWYPALAAPDATASQVVGNVATLQDAAQGVGKYLICWAEGNASKTRAEIIEGTVPSFSYTPKVALVKVSIQNTTASAITIKKIIATSDSDFIAGDVTLDVKTGAITGGSSKRAELVLNGETGESIAAGATSSTYVMAIIPTTGNLYFSAVDGEGIEIGLDGTKIVNPTAAKCYNRTPSILPVASNDLESEGLYYGVANSVVMPSGTTDATLDISLYAEGANHARGDLVTNLRSAAVSARVIWTEENLALDEYPEIYWMGNRSILHLTATSNTGGNALVGIYDGPNGTGNLLWSFHVWAPTDATVITEGLPGLYSHAYKLILGQVSGDTDSYMYYQWGRKDPLGRAVSTKDSDTMFAFDDVQTGKAPSNDNLDDTAATDISLSMTRQNPWIFYLNFMREIGTADNNLWSGSSSTIYDPCPENYHISKRDLWWNTDFDGYPTGGYQPGSGDKYKSASVSVSGLTYCTGGMRFINTGAVDSVVGYGRIWAADIAGDGSAYYLSLSVDQGLSGSGSHVFARGYGVRCVRN